MRDNRRYTRVSIRSVADIELPDGTSDNAYLGEISRGGMEMYTRSELQKNATYTIKPYFLFEGHELTETLKGQVKWSSSIKNDFIAGIQFTKVVTKENYPSLSLCIEQAEAYNQYFFIKG